MSITMSVSFAIKVDCELSSLSLTTWQMYKDKI